MLTLSATKIQVGEGIQSKRECYLERVIRQRPTGSEGAIHVDLWRTVFQAKGMASAKALRLYLREGPRKVL